MTFDHLCLVKLDELTELTRGAPEIKLGVIDGPVAIGHPDLIDTKILLCSSNSVACTIEKSQACSHGTFVIGMLGSRRGSTAPSICPDCTILARPIFSEKEVPTGASPKELAQSIFDCIHAGARAINMSVALSCQSTDLSDLKAALDYSANRGIIIVAAAGNTGTLASSVITSHPWVISVAACNSQGRLMEMSNFGSSIGRWGLMAPGDKIRSLSPDGSYITMSGTSVAAPFVTGAIGLLWSLFPEASPNLIRSNLMQNGRRQRSLIPPLLDAWGAYQFLTNIFSSSNKLIVKRVEIMENNELKEAKTAEVAQLSTPTSISEQNIEAAVMPQICGTCQKFLENTISSEVSEPTYIYAIGRIEPKFPSISIEKEFAQAVSRGEAKGLTDRETMHSIFSKRENRYLARKICWTMTIEGLETYILKPRDPGDLDMLLEAVRSEISRNDLDVVIGIKGPMAPPQLCNGLQVPIAFFDQVYSFDIGSLIKSVPRPEKTTAKEFEPVAMELFERIMQIADNAGATAEYRAMNYLAVRYPAIYVTVAQEFDRNCSLTCIDVLPSRLSGVRKIVDVVFTFTNRSTDVVEKFFTRVDVTEEFPFLVTKMSPYYDR
jgi:hypothetical protein